jgi:hypothetical protein
MSVSRRNFPGATEAELETWLGWVNDELATGKVTNSYSAGDTNFAKWIDMSLPPKTRQALILNDLSILNSTDYPPRNYASIKMTRPRYC